MKAWGGVYGAAGEKLGKWARRQAAALTTQMPSLWAAGGKKNPCFSKCPAFLNNTKGKQVGSPQTALCTQACSNLKGIRLSQQVWLMFSSRLCVRPKEEGVQGKTKSRGWKTYMHVLGHFLTSMVNSNFPFLVFGSL